MEEWPSVTIIVINYNGLKHLKPCFSSLSQLDYPSEKLALMLVDNASTDGSLAYLRQHFPRVQIVLNEKNFGFSGGNNRGVLTAQSKYIVFLNTDMRVDPHFLSALVSAVRSDPDIVCAGAKILNWDGSLIDFGGSAADFSGHAYQLGWGESPKEHQFDQIQPILFPCAGAMIIDRQVFLDIGGFDENYFLFYEDLDLGWRLWLLGYKVVFAPEAIVYHRFHGSVSSVPEIRKWVLYKRNALYTILKNYSDENLDKVLSVILLSSMAGLVNQTVRHMQSCSLSVEEQNAGTLAAVYEVVEHLSDVMEKRRAIQMKRCRSDEEITRLFHWPFRFWPDVDLHTQYPIAEAFKIQQIFKHLPRRVLIITSEEWNNGLEKSRTGILGAMLAKRGHTILFSVPKDSKNNQTVDLPGSLGRYQWEKDTLLSTIHSANPDIVLACDWSVLNLLPAEQLDYPILFDRRTPLGTIDNEPQSKFDSLRKVDFLISSDDTNLEDLQMWLMGAGWTEPESREWVTVISDPQSEELILPLDSFIRSPHIRARSPSGGGQYVEQVVSCLQEKDRKLQNLASQLQFLEKQLTPEQLQLYQTTTALEHTNIDLIVNPTFEEITSSRAWQFIVKMRQFRLKIIPRNSFLEKLFHLQPRKVKL